MQITTGRKYNLIVIDPPWNYKNSQKLSGCAQNHYKLLDLKELKSINIKDIIEKDCALFMWCTGPFLNQGIELGISYGFKFVTTFMVWRKLTVNGKRKPTNGFYTRQSCEYVLLFKRGSIFKLKKSTKFIDNFYSSPGKFYF